MKKQITINVEWDIKDEKVRKYLLEKTKDKKFEELLKECPELRKALLKGYETELKSQRDRASSIKRWQTSYNINDDLILNVLNNPLVPEQQGIKALLSDIEDKRKIEKIVQDIRDIFQKNYKPNVTLFDTMIKVTGLPLIDGRKRNKFPEIESLTDKAKKQSSKRERDKLNKIANDLRKIESKTKTLKRQELKAPDNPYISSQEMLNYQALELFKCIRRYVDKIDWKDKTVHGIIAELFNKIYGSQFKYSDIKDFIKNASKKLSPIKKK